MFNMCIATWKDGGFEIEVDRWDHEIFGEGGKGGLLNKKLVRAIRLLLDYSHFHDADKGSFVCCHTMDFKTIDIVSKSTSIRHSRQTLSRQVRELEKLSIVHSELGVPYGIRDTWTPHGEPAGRKGRMIESNPINSLTIKIDMKNLPELIGRKKDGEVVPLE